MLWCQSITPELRSRRQEGGQCKASLGYVYVLRFCLKKQKEEEEGGREKKGRKKYGWMAGCKRFTATLFLIVQNSCDWIYILNRRNIFQHFTTIWKHPADLNQWQNG